MKAVLLIALIGLCASSVVVQKGDRTITQVVSLLQKMLDKSVKEGDAERVIFAKFKCYCDTSEAERKASIKSLSEQIALLESSIEETQGSTGGLSSECADLKADIEANENAQKEAKTIRGKQNKAFVDEKADLKQAIGQMKNAIETLAAVGADQTSATGADNKQFMAGHKGASLLSLQTEMQSALQAATALMNPTQAKTATVFLQAPFTGTYTSQSAQVMGIIKSMRDTFKANLADAIAEEQRQLDDYNDFMELKQESHKEMKASYQKKQKELGGNDGDLGSDKSALAKANSKKTNDEEFLDKLIPMCKNKADGYENRKLQRSNEEAAIAEAISILNSDDAFASFGKTDATSSGATGGGFIQLRSVRKHVDSRTMAQKILKQATAETHSTKLTKVIALLQAENPFDEVLKEIDNMLDVIKEEGKADTKKHKWCATEQKNNRADRKQKNREMLSLNNNIDKLDKAIEHPKKGLKAMIAQTEDSLLQNRDSQKTETAERLEENMQYQQDIKNLVAAESILERATKVLAAYYDDLAEKMKNGESFLQEDPKAPDTWKGDSNFSGQSSKGNDVIGMLEFILKETVKEENQAHKDEEKAQAEFEDSMQDLKDKEAKDEKTLSGLQDTLATKEKERLDDQEDLKDTTADRDAIVDYLAQIKPGCDFIQDNIKERQRSQKTETNALNRAKGLIRGTPAYKNWSAKDTEESYGDCKSCNKDKNHVKCKACMGDVTIPAYCAGHKGTRGC